MIKRILQHQHWPLWIAILILVVAAIYFIYGWSYPFGDGFVIYWFDVTYSDTRILLSCIFIPAAFITFLFFVITAKKQKHNIGIAGILIIVLANLIACAACLPGMARKYQHRDTAEQGSHVYYVSSSYGVIGLGGVSDAVVEMFECDSAGLLCRVVYRYTRPISTSEYKANPWDVSLVTNPTTNNVSIQIDGEIVYTHHP